MATFESTAQAAEYAMSAFKKMHELKIPATPENYTIWYKWAAGSDSDLVRHVDQLIQESQHFDETCCEEIYNDYVNQSSSHKVIEANHKLEETLQLIVKSLDGADERTEDYADSLQDFGKILDDSVGDHKELSHFVSSLTQKTLEVARQNKELQATVQHTSSEMKTLRENLESAQEAALTDGLTAIANRKAFEQTLTEARQESITTQEPLCLMMLDIDHFKKFNDTHGHRFGDQVLKLVARTIQKCIKGKDTVARYGGEEFSVIAPATSLHDAKNLAEQICRTIASQEIVKKSSSERIGAVTISVGVAQYKFEESLGDLVQRADMALYSAKEQGRNRAITENEIKQAA